MIWLHEGLEIVFLLLIYSTRDVSPRVFDYKDISKGDRRMSRLVMLFDLVPQ